MNNRYRQARKATLIAILANVALSVLKLVLGVLGHSQGLVADGVHSVSDIFTDLFVLIAAKTSSQAPDRSHPYGHGRIETVFTIILAILLITVGLGIAYDAFRHIFILKHFIRPHAIFPLSIAIISILVNEVLFRYTLQVGYRIESELLQANAWHHRSDALSSFVVCVGIIGSLFNFHYLDSVAAVVVALLIIQIGFRMIRKGVGELVDRSVDDTVLNYIVEEIKKVSGVNSVHQLRSRFVGGKIFIDVHIQVDSKISVSEGHYIGNVVHKRLMKSVPKMMDITVHIDSEDDAFLPFYNNLPSRKELEKKLMECWNELVGHRNIEKINLHYLNKKVDVEIVLPLAQLSRDVDRKELTSKYSEAIEGLDYISSLRVYFTE